MKRINGYLLLEISIALIILNLLITAMVHWWHFQSKQNQLNLNQLLALVQMQNLLERFKNLPAIQRENEYQQWRNNLLDRLPNYDYSYRCTAENNCSITLKEPSNLSFTLKASF